MSNEALAEIYNLSGEILSGTATEAEIKRVTKLAKEHDLLSVLKKEFHDIHITLTEGS